MSAQIFRGKRRKRDTLDKGLVNSLLSRMRTDCTGARQALATLLRLWPSPVP